MHFFGFFRVCLLFKNIIIKINLLNKYTKTVKNNIVMKNRIQKIACLISLGFFMFKLFRKWKSYSVWLFYFAYFFGSFVAFCNYLPIYLIFSNFFIQLYLIGKITCQLVKRLLGFWKFKKVFSTGENYFWNEINLRRSWEILYEQSKKKCLLWWLHQWLTN